MAISMIPPFPSAAPDRPSQLVLVFRNCTSQVLQLSGQPGIHLFLSAAGAKTLEDSGPAPIAIAFDYFTPGNPEDQKRMAPVALKPGEIAHVLLAYYGHGEHWQGGYVPDTRLQRAAGSCSAADVISVDSAPAARVFQTPIEVCGAVYVSEYRRGPFVRGERISADFLQGGPKDGPGPEVTGPLMESAALDKQTDIGLRDCEADDLDIGFDAPDHTIDPAVAVFHLQNIAARPCVIWHAPGLGYIKGQVFDSAGVRSCVNCSPDNNEDFRKPVPEVILHPQDKARVTLAFRTKSDVTSGCKQVDGIGFGVSNGSRNAVFRLGSGIPVCSRVDVTPVTLDDANAPAASSRISLTLASARLTYYDGERIVLHVVAKGPANLLAVDDHSCLRLFQRSRSPDGSTRLDAALAQTCKASSALPDWSTRQVEMDIDAAHRSRWGGRGEHMIDVAIEAPPGARQGAYLAKSNTLHLTIADASAIARRWGSEVKGVAVDLTLDKNTYALGQDIALHAAVKNSAADTPIYGEVKDCRGIVRLAVRDAADGLLVKQTSGFPFPRICGGPVVPGLAQYAPGQIVPQELTLQQAGWLPSYAGNFTVSASWTVYDCQLCDPQHTKPYAVATSGARPFRIIDPNHLELDPAPPAGVLSRVLATRFEQVDTTFGAKTALKDKATGLQWLHLDITAGMSYSQVSQALGAGGRFEGWRYATAAELRDFFSHFDGASDGYSTDPAIQAQLQRNLGGPLDVSSNPSTGWRRASSAGLLGQPFGLGQATGGYVAEDSLSGSVIDPRTNGSSSPGATPPNLGSYLVRRD